MAKAKSSGVVKGTMILIAGNLIVKIIGALFKLPLANIIGADGMGLYNSAFTVYDIFLVLSTSGYTLAISKLVASNCARGRGDEALRILSSTRRLFWGLGLFFTAAMLIGSRFYAGLIGNTRSTLCILVLAPSVLFVSLMCAYRGYYQGTNDMLPTTASQIIEAVVRLVCGLSFSWFLKAQGYGIEIASAGAIAGITIGEFSSTSSLALMHRAKMRRREKRGAPKPIPRRSRGLYRTLLATAIPIGVSSIIISLINVCDNGVVLRRLQSIGYTEQQSNTLYGAFNMAFTIFGLPVTIVFAITTSVFPVLSFAHACKNDARVAHISEAALRVGMMVTSAAAAVFASLSGPIVRVLYFGQPRDAALAGPLLMLMTPAAIVLSLSVLTATVLQAVDKLIAPSRSMIVGGIVCLASNWMLVGLPQVGIYGVPVGLFLCYLVTTVLNLAEIRKVGLRLRYGRLFFRPLLPAAVLGVVAGALSALLVPVCGALNGGLVALAAGLLCYVLVLFSSGTVERGDFALLPGGKKAVRILEKLRLLQKPENGVLRSF